MIEKNNNKIRFINFKYNLLLKQVTHVSKNQLGLGSIIPISENMASVHSSVYSESYLFLKTNEVSQKYEVLGGSVAVPQAHLQSAVLGSHIGTLV